MVFSAIILLLVLRLVCASIGGDAPANRIVIDKGLSVVLIERGEGVETSAIKTSYSPAAGTTFITFDNVKVPVENLLGEENKGIHVILSNFNHERWMMACAVIRSSRLVTEECMKWSNQRLVFGKKLIEQPVIRQK
jgi:alkylation response protein AidB-like acyl-CoA dehydrogenase